jgi:hypothetical protein
VHRDALDQRLEVVRARDEVGLAVDLDQDADAAARVDVRLDEAFDAARSALDAALAAPRLRRFSIARSRSPLLSASAFLHSIMPTPVRWRSSMTCFGEISANMVLLLGIRRR